MNKSGLLSVLVVCVFSINLYAQKTLPPGELAIIPKPQSITYQQGTYIIGTHSKVAAFAEFLPIADLLKEHPYIEFESIETIKKRKHIPGTGIRLLLPDEKDKLAKDAYRIEVDSQGIVLVAHNTESMINAVMTLIQIAYIQKDGTCLPYLKMEDAPRFGYRGLHLDVSRHFFPISFLEKYIDLMALYKLNTFHWHLTDGAGWRLAISKYPELTQKASWRNYTTWKDWWNSPRRYVEMGHPNASGGFYTQEEARNLVKYAARKGITIIPEIEMPGHSEEVLAVYPHLSCSGQPYTNSEFCIGNEDTFIFLTDVLTEVIDVFPSQYIHIGGDEGDKTAWKSCSKCQKRIKDENLKNVDELQSYAIKRMETFLRSKGRKLIGWDEILEGGLAPGATVMSWRGEAGSIKAANSGHDVIMTPTFPLYFDSYQNNPVNEPEAIGGFVSLSDVYAYEPIAKGIEDKNKKHVLGVQANVWTEYMPTSEQVEYMAFPRVLALSEVAWTAAKDKDWADFEKRMQSHYLLLQAMDVNYHRPSYKPYIQATYNPTTKSSEVRISSQQYQPIIRYTTDGSNPTASSPRYTEPLELLKSAKVKAATFADSVRLGAVDSLLVDIHKAIGKKVHYNNPWDKYGAKGDSTLVNGTKGSFKYGDREWQSFTKGGVNVVIDFERREEINSVSIRFMQSIGPGIYMPETVTLEVSDNGKNYVTVQTIKNTVPKSEPRLTFKDFTFKLNSKMTRYIRIKAANPGEHFLFTDEIVVY